MRNDLTNTAMNRVVWRPTTLLGALVARKSKKLKRRAWKPIDVREFKKLARAKRSAPQLASRFKRTVGAIRQKALQLGMSLDTRA
jgi:hypothetical protein